MESHRFCRKFKNLVEGEKIFVRCRSIPGVFSHERGRLRFWCKKTYESLVDQNFVKGVEDKSKVIASVVKVNGDTILIELPGEVIAGNRRVWINKTEVA